MSPVKASVAAFSEETITFDSRDLDFKLKSQVLEFPPQRKFLGVFFRYNLNFFPSFEFLMDRYAV